MLFIQPVLTVSELAAKGTNIPDIMVKRGLHGYSLYGFLHIKNGIFKHKKNNKDNLDEGKLQGTKYASIYPSFWIVIYQEYNNSHIKLR